jgi:prepilin-type N-terminal cleavage/methylation domain-containing protein/prepilin-type processing-associated H-X9-DG protein
MTRRKDRTTTSGRGAAPRATSAVSRGRQAFTLIELLVVVAIIALLVAILTPAVGKARQVAMQAVCLSNVHQLAIAGEQYTHTYRGMYPIADSPMETIRDALQDRRIYRSWDFTHIQDNMTGRHTWQPGVLWEGRTNAEVQKCPAFRGSSNWMGNADPYTGYNYNTSFLGTYRPKGRYTPAVSPASTTDVRSPARCAMFGDGEYGSGANKFMRSPDPRGARDDWFTPGRYAGTQGFRHLGRTSVAFCDGHAESRGGRCSQVYPALDVPKVAAGTGFLSLDNSLYDLK